MSARKIRNAWYVDLRHDGMRYRKKSPEDSKRGAEAYEAHLRSRLARGESIEVGQKKKEPAFDEFIPEWLKTYVNTNNKPSEQTAKRLILSKHLLPFFGKYRLKDITQGVIERYKASKLGVLHEKTVNNHLTVLRKALVTAHEWGLVDSVPCFKWHRPMRQTPRFLREDEIVRLLQVQMESPWREMMVFALNTGLRVGELRALHWEDVDLLSGVITVRRAASRHIIGTPKSNRYRTVPLNTSAVAILNSLLNKGVRSGLVFTQTDELLSYHTATKHLHRAAKAAGVSVFSWHTLRHTFASRLVQRGAGMRAIQSLLGHSTVVMTERYAHLAPSSLQGTVELLNETPQMSSFGQPVGNGTLKFVLASQGLGE